MITRSASRRVHGESAKRAPKERESPAGRTSDSASSRSKVLVKFFESLKTKRLCHCVTHKAAKCSKKKEYGPNRTRAPPLSRALLVLVTGSRICFYKHQTDQIVTVFLLSLFFSFFFGQMCSNKLAPAFFW